MPRWESDISASPRLIGVTGGIGAGKSVVCRIAALRGLPLYDCDREAKLIMDSSQEIKDALRDIVAGEVILPGGVINRPLLARILFADGGVRMAVNKLVHTAVREDIRRWSATLSAPAALIESAILHSSGLDACVDAIWLVDAPEEKRICRVMARNSMARNCVEARIASQREEFALLPKEKTSVIVNDGIHPLLPQINHLITLILTYKHNA